jgi:hypothetical protein
VWGARSSVMILRVITRQDLGGGPVLAVSRQHVEPGRFGEILRLIGIDSVLIYDAAAASLRGHV